MLANFKVRNFRNFRDDIDLNFQNIKNYEFNEDAISNGIIKDAIFYGPNAAGKTSLGYALLDITLHMCDKNKQLDDYAHYTNLNSLDKTAHFEYTFQFEKGTVHYLYEKTGPLSVTREELSINGRKVIFSESGQSPQTLLRGTEQLNIDFWDSNMSFVKYVLANTKLKTNEDVECALFYDFYNFVNHMLFFSSVNNNRYIGSATMQGSVCQLIAEADQTEKLQNFLKEMGIFYQLETGLEGTKPNIYAKFNGGTVLLQDVWSSGTRALVGLFLWLTKAQKLSFMYLDEFDAYYHYEMAMAVVKYLKKMNVQVILTSHNTNLMTNELLRPDCNFELRDNRIVSFADRTNKALRKAHNIPKMYKAGAFNE